MNGIHAGGLRRVRFFMPSGGYKNSCPREATKIHALEQALGHEFLVASLWHEFLVAALGHEKPYTPETPGMNAIHNFFEHKLHVLKKVSQGMYFITWQTLAPPFRN